MTYISVYAKCKCGCARKNHNLMGRRPTKEHPTYASCGTGSYPIYNRYKGACIKCKNCNKFELNKKPGE